MNSGDVSHPAQPRPSDLLLSVNVITDLALLNISTAYGTFTAAPQPPPPPSVTRSN